LSAVCRAAVGVKLVAISVKDAACGQFSRIRTTWVIMSHVTCIHVYDTKSVSSI